jgi:hypothetical protein
MPILFRYAAKSITYLASNGSFASFTPGSMISSSFYGITQPGQVPMLQRLFGPDWFLHQGSHFCI